MEDKCILDTKHTLAESFNVILSDFAPDHLVNEARLIKDLIEETGSEDYHRWVCSMSVVTMRDQEADGFIFYPAE